MYCAERYADSVKRHNVCKRHVTIDTGVKQTERTIFLHVTCYFNRIRIVNVFKCIFEEIVPQY